MLLRRGMLLVWCAVLAAAEDAPQGLVSKDSHQDLIAEATQTGSQAQKREAGLLNSYGDPLPPDAYGPPQEVTLVSHFAELPPQPPVYGPPQGPPAGAYGPPAPVVFPSQSYEGPPPPRPSYPQRHYGPPKNSYPKHSYGPPKFSYKKNYGIKQSLPKPTYGLPFKTQKLFGPKPIYGPPKQIYSPPKPIYGPPKFTYGPPLTAPVHNVNVPDVSTVTVTSNIGSVSNNFDLGLNLPAPIYGTPLISLPQDLKPNFPIPADTYGPPGQVLGPIGPPVDQVVVHDTNIAYGPPQPDPNPQPPHPGIPAPPTPPHVIYDGWKPIPGATNPIGLVENVDDQYGPPPPPSDLILDQGLPSVDNHQFFSIDSQSAPIESQNQQFSTQITTGYSSVHQDALANVDLNAIIGGDTNNIDQAKTVFEAHYTDNSPQLDFAIQGAQRPQISISQDSYLSPPVDSNSGGPYASSLRAQGAKLLPPSGVYGVPPGSQYGAPPKALPPHLPIPYGSISGGPHSTQGWPKQPIKFRDPVPNGLLEHVGQATHGKDTHGFDHGSHGPAYIPPPIRDVKDNNIHTGNLGLNSVSLSIEPTNLFSLPHAGSPLNFQVQQPSSISYQTPASYPSNSYGPPLAIQQPSTSYGSPIDSYSVPLLTVGDHTASGSSDNAVTTTIDGTLLANLSNLDAAAILKHCPYHEAILKAARSGEKIPSDLAAKYVESLNSLGSSLGKNIFSDNQIVSEQNVFNIPVSSGESITFNTKDYSSGQTVVQAIHPEYKGEKYEKNKSKSLRDIGKQIKDEKIQYVTDEIYKTSEKIKSLSEETKRLQQKINSNNHNFNHIQQSNNEIPVKGKLGTYSLQIQSSNGKGSPSIPHEQLLSEGLLQSILQAIEQPAANGQIVQTHHTQAQNVVTSAQSIQPNYFQQPPSVNLGSFNNEGLVLPAGYEPIDRTKDKKDQDTQSSSVDIKKMLNNEIINNQRGDIPDCEIKGEHSIRHSVVAPPNYEIKPVEELEDNDVAVYFDRKSDDNIEPVTEISVATSISDNLDSYNTNSKKYGEKIKKT